jgi:hypothetical protein
MPLHIYTAEEISELTNLANEARELDAEWRAVMAQAGEIIDRLYGFTYSDRFGTHRSTQPGWHCYPETADLADAVSREFRVAPFQQLPKVGEAAYKRIQRATEWRKLNNRTRKEIVFARNVVAKYVQEQSQTAEVTTDGR